MRRHATAHLGKIESELRPTVIVTESDTVLLGSNEKESRRIKRVPKKFEDYENTVSKSLAMSDSERDEPASKKQKTKGEEFKPRLKQPETNTPEELFSIKQEIKKMLHVSVDVRRLEFLDDVEPWCMVHKLYKCHCKGLMTKEAIPVPALEPPRKITEFKKLELPKNVMPKKVELPTPVTPEEQLVDDGFSRRVLPVTLDNSKVKKSPEMSAMINSIDRLPKMEIVNLCDLINGGIGPIFINVYDDRTMRLNPILRSVLNNKSAIIYFEGFAYFVDKKRVDINKLDFRKMEPELEHPIFIVQGKDAIPPPISSTMADDFVNFLFHKNSNSFIQIIEKNALKEISVIIESILRNVRKKIEAKVGTDTNDLVKEQLSMLTQDRSRSTSFSSTNSSPLSFNGHRLAEAPPPGMNTPMMQEFNKIFSIRMQRLVALIGSNTLGLKPSNEMLNKFYIYQWHFMLQSFEEGLIQIWQVRLEGESGTGYQMLVLTDTRDVPEVEHAKREHIVNIRKLKLSENITELTRMILLRVENASMKNMTVLFYGCKGYMRICGILNSKDNYLSSFVAKPTRATHPRIAAKIQKIYHIWHASKACRDKRKQEIEKENSIRILREARQGLQARQLEDAKNTPMISNIEKKVRFVKIN